MRHLIISLHVIWDFCINLNYIFFSFVASGEKELQWQGLNLAVVFLKSAGCRSAGSAQVEIVTGQKPTSPDLYKFYAMGFDCHLLLRSSHCHHFYHHFWHYCHSHNQSSFCQFCFLYLDWLEFLWKMQCIGYGLNWHINNKVLTNHQKLGISAQLLQRQCWSSDRALAWCDNCLIVWFVWEYIESSKN